MKHKSKDLDIVKEQEKILWSDRKRWWCGLPFTFTQYTMSESRLLVETGFLNSKEAEVRLYRITNIRLTHSLIQKLFGLGTIHIDSSDKDFRAFNIINIKNAKQVKEALSQQVESERKKNRVSARELFTDDGEEDEDFDDHEDNN